MEITVLGSINRDFIARATRLPQVGETVHGNGMDISTGGKGANQAVQAALLHTDTHFIGCVGDDVHGEIVAGGLREKGVDTAHLYTLEGVQTGTCVIYVDQRGDNMLVYSPGANDRVSETHVDRAAQQIAASDIFIAQNEVNLRAVRHGLKTARQAGVPTLLNPAPAIPLPDELFGLASYITPNETESEVYTGIYRKDMDFDTWKRESADWFLRRGVRGVCLTLGSRGSYYYDGQVEITMPAFSIIPVDTTAAGDSFNAGFAYGIASGWDMQRCLLYGNACGAMTSMRSGALSAICDKSEIDAFILANKPDSV